ncbi:MAG: helix-turn-helix domain-containing protein [Eubacterium sp.]|nr:helix-turn-helix domain-containing protein [Eubacterium sp.]
MTEQEFKNTVAKKIAYYRKLEGITQGELAEILNYSDKSVSKWERGEGLPDTYVLSLIAEHFGVTLNDLTSEKEPKISGKFIRKREFVPYLSVGLVWLVAAVVFFILIILPINIGREWLAFIYAIPVSFIVATVFSCIWYGLLPRAVCISGIIWGTFTAIIVTFPVAKVAYLLIACLIFQALVILWFYMIYRTRKNG